MALQVEKIDTRDIQIGMYISQLDRPWIDTPFPLQGFHVRDQDDLERLQIWCRHVYVDRQLSNNEGPASDQPAGATSERKRPNDGHATSHTASTPRSSRTRQRVRGTLGRFTPAEYRISQPLKKEVAAVAPYHKEVTRAMVQLLKGVREGKGINLRVARKAASVVVHSIIRNPDAMVWLARIKDQDAYSYSHSIRCAILATVFGRHIGLPKETLENLATGALLMDVGKLQVSRSLLVKPDALTPTEMTEMRQHVAYGLAMLENQSGITDQVMAVVEYHHERHDGSGYPHQLSGSNIPLLARIAGIVDTYDAVTSSRPWAQAQTANEAVRMLYDLRDTAFHGPLVEQFIQAIGVYPTGTAVQLSDHQVGVVVAQNPDRRLRPQVLLFQDAEGQALTQPRIVNLQEVTQDRWGQQLSISAALQPEACSVDLSSVQLNAA